MVLRACYTILLIKSYMKRIIKIFFYSCTFGCFITNLYGVNPWNMGIGLHFDPWSSPIIPTQRLNAQNNNFTISNLFDDMVYSSDINVFTYGNMWLWWPNLDNYKGNEDGLKAIENSINKMY